MGEACAFEAGDEAPQAVQGITPAVGLLGTRGRDGVSSELGHQRADAGQRTLTIELADREQPQPRVHEQRCGAVINGP